VHLQLAHDRLATPAGAGSPTYPVPSRPVPPRDALLPAAALIGEARRPVVIAGGGAVDCPPAMAHFLASTGAACASTVAGKGIVDEMHSLSLGCALPRKAVRDFLRSCDLAIVVGSELSRTDFGPEGPLLPGRVIRIDIDAQALATNCRSDIALLGDAGATLEALASLTTPREAGIAEDDVARARVASHLEAHRQRPGMEAILSCLRRVLPADTVIAADGVPIEIPCLDVKNIFTRK